MPEVAGDAAVYCDPQSATSIAAGIVALQDPEQAAALRARGRRRLAAFTWEATARQMVAVYERAAAGRGRHAVSPPAEQAELVGAGSRGAGS
jgi:glycosyltransferase involved in cell wall biosynthesis